MCGICWGTRHPHCMATTLIIFNNQQQSAHTRGGAASTLNFADESGAIIGTYAGRRGNHTGWRRHYSYSTIMWMATALFIFYNQQQSGAIIHSYSTICGWIWCNHRHIRNNRHIQTRTMMLMTTVMLMTTLYSIDVDDDSSFNFKFYWWCRNRLLPSLLLIVV